MEKRYYVIVKNKDGEEIFNHSAEAAFLLRNIFKNFALKCKEQEIDLEKCKIETNLDYLTDKK